MRPPVEGCIAEEDSDGERGCDKEEEEEEESKTDQEDDCTTRTTTKLVWQRVTSSSSDASSSSDSDSSSSSSSSDRGEETHDKCMVGANLVGHATFQRSNQRRHATTTTTTTTKPWTAPTILFSMMTLATAPFSSRTNNIKLKVNR